MTLSLHIKNFGKIRKANIGINNLTVFGGTNNTGKSYASRTLYAIFDTRNANTTDEYFEFLLRKIMVTTDKLYRDVNFVYRGGDLFEPDNNLRTVAAALRKLCNSNFTLLEKLSENGLDGEFRQKGLSMVTSTKKIITMLGKFSGKSKSRADRQQILSRRGSFDHITNIIEKELEEFKNSFDLADEEILRKSYRGKLTQNFLHNFQIRGLSELIGKEKFAPAEIVIKEKNITLIGVSISPEGKLKLDIPGMDGLKHLEEFSRVLYLESPLYWKLESPLIRASRMRGRYITDSPEETLTGVPKYFNDAHNAMTARRTVKPFIDHEIETIIGGKIIRNERDDLVFVEKEGKEEKRPISLPLTASGVIQLGMLGHLIETRVIQEGSILFIDEPEAHLHPEWQQKIIEVLYKLSEAGVMVIIATHSPVIMEWIEVYVKYNPESKDYIALNSFHKDGEFDCIDKGYDKNMNEIIEDLTKTFSDLYMREL